MPAPFKQEFDLGGIRITSLVMDETEFVALCKEFIGIFPGFDEAAAQKCIKAKIIPGMGKGSKTVQFFLENGALYWHMVDVIWIFLFPLLYLIT